MFKNHFYMTRGVSEEIDQFTTLKILESIQGFSSDKDLETDYFLVLKLSKEDDLQKLEISQERPERVEDFYFRSSNTYEAKLYAIDDIDHSTLLFPNEY